jgi:hypothetical protein
VKGPRTGDGRVELGWPLGETRDAVGSRGDRRPVDVAPLLPLARIENARTAYLLIGPVAWWPEFVDDRVRGTDLRHGGQPEWREWEMELGPAAPADEAGRVAFFHAVERRSSPRAAGSPPPDRSSVARSGSERNISQASGLRWEPAAVIRRCRRVDGDPQPLPPRGRRA